MISPHLDDAVLSCTSAILGAVDPLVVTVFAADPDPSLPLTTWDRVAGFRSGTESIRARRCEDAASLHTIGATPHWLDHLDAQYRHDGLVPDIATALQAITAGAGHVIAPLGLRHDDHVIVADAICTLVPHLCANGIRVSFYADVPYRALDGGSLVSQRLTVLRERGVELAESVVDWNAHVRSCKAAALAKYTSQLVALRVSWEGPLDDLDQPEQLWTVAMRQDD